MSHALTAHELEDIRSSYEEELSGLTFNSKPIINMLTTIAQENLNAAAVICRTIEDRVRMAPPHQKLPVMYLLDSISKNVGSPFTPIFGRNLYKTFMDCYTTVDSNTRRALEALFSTWKLPVAGSSSPVPVYAAEDTRKIDDALMRMRAIQDRNVGYNQYVNPPVRYGSASPFPQQLPPRYASPTTTIDPYGYPEARQHSVPVIGQDLYPGYRQSPEISARAPAIHNPLADSIINDIGGLLRTLDTRARLNPQDATTVKFITTLRGLHDILTTQNLRPLQLEDIRNSLREVAAYCAQPVRPAQRFSPPPVLQSATQPGALQAPPMDLFRQLANAGIIPPSGSNTPMSLPIFQPPRPTGAYIELSSAAMLQSRPELIDVLYSSMPLQCYQCGQRWHDTPEDRTAKDVHLDLHFKTNKRLREHSVRSQSRALYLTETDWIHFTLSDDSDVQHASSEGKTVDVSTSTVPKPSNPDLHDTVCPVCKETFDTDWDDGNEQWVWKNAVNVAGIVYHATCHAETLAVQKRDNAAKMVKQGKTSDDKMNEGEVDSEDEDIALPGAIKQEPTIVKQEPAAMPEPQQQQQQQQQEDELHDGGNQEAVPSIKQEQEHEEQNEQALEKEPIRVSAPIKQEKRDIAAELLSTVKADSALPHDARMTVLPEGLAAALKSLSGSLNVPSMSAANHGNTAVTSPGTGTGGGSSGSGVKRKASDELHEEDGDDRRVKRESP